MQEANGVSFAGRGQGAQIYSWQRPFQSWAEPSPWPSPVRRRGNRRGAGTLPMYWCCCWGPTSDPLSHRMGVV